MFGWIPEKNHHLGQRRGFEVAGNLIKTWFLPFLLTRFGIFPCCCPYLMGRSKPCGCDSIPKIDPLHPLKEKKSMRASDYIYIYQFADGSKPSQPIYYHMSRTSKHSSYFTDQFKPAGMIFLQFFVPAISDSPSLQPWKRRATSEVGWLMSHRRGEN